MRIGYLIPEFPSQTHIFFWREKKALEKLGIELGVVSTRQPAASLAPHSWSGEAISQTYYLFPPGPRAVFASMLQLLLAGPSGWWRCLTAVATAEVRSASDRLRLAMLAVMGWQLAWLARRRGWSHVHVHSCADCANIAMFAHLLSGLPYSLTLHGTLAYYGPNQQQKWRHASFAIVVAKHLLEEVRSQLDSSLPERVEIAPMGVDVDIFRRRSPYRPWGGRGPLRIFSCSRLNPGKGQDDVIRAVALVREQGIEAELRIAGADDSGTNACLQSLERLAADLAVSESVHFLGAVPHETVRAELEQAHVFVLASHYEALGVATMEAMAMQLPVVVARVGGVPELVEDGVEGLLVDSHTPEQIAKALTKIARHTGAARRFGEAGRKKIRGSFYSTMSAEAITECLQHTEATRSGS